MWLRVGARTERLGAQSSPVVPPHGFLNTIPYSVHPPHAFTPAMKLQSSQTPHPRHFQYRPSSAPTPLRTRDVCEAWHLRSFGTRHLELYSPSWRSSSNLLHIFTCHIYLRQHLFLFAEFNPSSAYREAFFENGVSWHRVILDAGCASTYYYY